MNIFLVDINGFTFNSLEKLMNYCKVDEIIDARMNLGSVALRNFYKGKFPQVRYLIKLANSTVNRGYTLEYRKGDHETSFGKMLNRICSSTGKVVGVENLIHYVWYYNIMLREEITALLSPTINQRKCIFSDCPIGSYFYDTSNDLSHIVDLYLKKHRGEWKIDNISKLKSLLQIIKDKIVNAEENKENYYLSKEGSELFDMNMAYYTKEPQFSHFIDVNNICVLYNGGQKIRNLFFEIFSPDQYKYESLPEWDRYNHDIEYIDDYNNDFDDNRDCYKLEHWIKFQEINREKFFEIEEYDLCKTDKDYQKLKEEKSKWLKWKTKNELNKYYVLDENYNNYDYREDDEKDNQRDAFYAMHNDIDDIYENDKYDPFWDNIE